MTLLRTHLSQNTALPQLSFFIVYNMLRFIEVYPPEVYYEDYII